MGSVHLRKAKSIFQETFWAIKKFSSIHILGQPINAGVQSMALVASFKPLFARGMAEYVLKMSKKFMALLIFHEPFLMS